MELINHTDYPAMLFKTALLKNDMAASVIVRVTYDINSGKAVPSKTQSWMLYNSNWENEYGPMEGDNIFKLGGVDILIFGSARTPGAQQLRRMEVKITVEGKLSQKLFVFGNRFWENGFLGMTMSVPQPFTEIPMTLFNAYGGKADWDGIKLPYGNNPFGKGYYWERNEAINNILPNIEDPINLIKKWDDRPDPVGITSCPMNELRVRGNVEYNSMHQLKKINARFFNTAFPKMIVTELLPGEKITIDGMTSQGNFVFEIPKHYISVKVKLGEKVKVRPLVLDQVGIIVDKHQAFITYRFPFRYIMEPMQIRTCEIFEIE